ncbi:MAG TPA: porin family protein [Bacteroidales bacterium]|nr:porin family protein [Bacteroidales bacterium]
MKKVSLVLIVLLNILFLSGQEGLRLGVNLDPLASWLTPKTNLIDKEGTRPGISGGLIVEYYFHPNYGIVTGLNIGSQGGSVIYREAVNIKTGDNESVNLEAGSGVVYTLSYITLPIGLKLKTNEIGYLTYFAQLGFNQQINIGSRASSTGNELNKDNVPKESNLLNMSYYFGGGAEYNIGGQTSIIAGLFFNNGFADVLSNNDHKAVLNYLTIRVGVLF